MTLEAGGIVWLEHGQVAHLSQDGHNATQHALIAEGLNYVLTK
jgi:hypothetical protein